MWGVLDSAQPTCEVYCVSDDELWGDEASRSGNPAMSRTVLGALLALLMLAILLAVWFLLFGGDNDETATSLSTTAPTAIPIPTSTPVPPAAAATAAEPTAVATSVPSGFEACSADRAPLVTATYIVDTIETPLNQRSEPSINGDLVGSFEAGSTGLSFTGECLVNITDGFVWWQINNGEVDVWVASDFVTPN